MEITYSPSALPGSCYFCGSGNREYYIDTKQSVEFHGAMYVCNLCVDGMAKLVNYIHPDDYKELLAKTEEQQAQLYEYSKKLSVLEGVLRDLANAGYTVHDDGSISRAGGSILEDVLEPKPPASTRKRKLGTGEGTAPEPSNDEDLGVVHSDDDSDATKLFGL